MTGSVLIKMQQQTIVHAEKQTDRGGEPSKQLHIFLFNRDQRNFSPLESNSTKVNSICHQLRLQPQENRLSRFIQICNYVISAANHKPVVCCSLNQLFNVRKLIQNTVKLKPSQTNSVDVFSSKIRQLQFMDITKAVFFLAFIIAVNQILS